MLAEQILSDFVWVPQDVSVTGQGCRTLQDRNVVLVVDDDPGMLKGVQRLLRLHEYNPVLFSSAEDFRKHADVEKAVCVILDINLNDGSGIELRHRLKADGHSVPVIYMTASDNPAVRRAALNSGCIAFLTKPFSTHSLIEPLKKASAGIGSADLRSLMACSRFVPCPGDHVIRTPIGPF